MARIPYLSRNDLEPNYRHTYDEIMRTRGVVWPNFQVLFHSPEATDRLASFGAYVRFDSDIPVRLKELAILCAAREANNAFVWTAHEEMARDQNVSESVINAIRNETAPIGLSGKDAAVVRFAKELLIHKEISDDTFSAVHRLFGDKGTVDLTLLILYYTTLALALQAFLVDLPEGIVSTLTE
jgi:4-carboxymuconolactone decarboxylase